MMSCAAVASVLIYILKYIYTTMFSLPVLTARVVESQLRD